MRRKEHVLRRAEDETYRANYTFYHHYNPLSLLSQFSIICTNIVLLILIIANINYNHHSINCINDFSIASLTINGNSLVTSSDQNNEQFLGRCLECICEASSGCQTNNRRCESYYCGPYQLSYTYWADSGATTTQKKSPSRISGPKANGDNYVASLSVSPKDFEQCALDKSCSARTVRNYFLKYLKDCDGDNRITCADMASIHRAGADVCNADWLHKTKFWFAFSKSECYMNLNNSNNQSARLSNRLASVSVIVSGSNSSRSIVNPENSRDIRGTTLNENAISHYRNGTNILRGTSNQTRPVLVSTRSASNFLLRNNINIANNDDLDRFSSSNNNNNNNNLFINDNQPALNDNSEATSLDRTTIHLNQQQQQIDKQCMNCICEAQSNCDLSGRNCRSGTVCGPFSITPGYWSDGGKPGLDWLTCTKNRDCSELTVRNYMERYKRDCNNDGKITCLDYGAIHHLGGSACTQMSSLSGGDKYFERFNRCLERQTRVNRINITTTSNTNTNSRPNSNNNNPANRFVLPGSSSLSFTSVVTSGSNQPSSVDGNSALNSDEFPRIPTTTTTTNNANEDNPTIGTALTNTLNHLPAIQPEIMNSIPQLPRRLVIGQSRPPMNNRQMNRNLQNDSSSFTANNNNLNDRNNNSGEETSRDDVTIEFETRDVFSSTSRRITNGGTPIRDTDRSTGFIRNTSGVVRGASIEEVYPRIPTLVADLSVTPNSDFSDENSERYNINNNANPSNNRQPSATSFVDENNNNNNNGNSAPINNGDNNSATEATNSPIATDDVTVVSNSATSLVSDEAVSATSDTTSTTLWPNGGGSSFSWPDHNQPIGNPLTASFSSRVPTSIITSDIRRSTTSLLSSPRLSTTSTSTTTTTTTTTITTTPRPTTTTTTTTSSTTAQPRRISDEIERLSPDTEYPKPPIPVEINLQGTRVRSRTINEPRTTELSSEPLEASEISRRSEPILPKRERTGSFETISLDEPSAFINENENKSSLNSPYRLDRPDRRLLANRANSRKITTECFECICEASTSCDLKSRCQTSDVKHTRCGMYLISYDQWLESGLSKSLTSPEAIGRDPAADERSFYDCVTNQGCAEKLLNLYMDKRLRDCDGDGRINCYDVAAIHRAGPINCHSEAFLETQYWGDFNACYGFNQAFKRRR